MRFEMAAAFDSDMPYDRVLEVLGAETGWSWQDRDSAWYGNLATARVRTAHGSLRLALMESGPNGVGGQACAGEGRRYSISAILTSSGPQCNDEWEAVRATLEARVLPALKARNVCPTDTIDD